MELDYRLMVLEVYERRLSWTILVSATASNPLKMAVTVKYLSQNVELTAPVHIVTYDNISPRPFI